jgi:transposase-like protein
MIQRCTNPKNDEYARYGGRGIKVCLRWRKFRNFLEDMGLRPEDKTLDRWPDKDGDYKPSNCRWATVTEQNRNLRSTKLTADDAQSIRDSVKQGLSYTQLAERFGVSSGHISDIVNQYRWVGGSPITKPRRGEQISKAKKGRTSPAIQASAAKARAAFAKKRSGV